MHYEFHVGKKNYKLTQIRVWKNNKGWYREGECYGISGFEAFFVADDGFVGYEPISLMFGEKHLTREYEVLDFSH